MSDSGGGGGGGGSGDLTAVTSTDGSITLTNGTGPVPDLSVSGVLANDALSTTDGNTLRLQSLGYVEVNHLTALGYVQLNDPYVLSANPTLTLYDSDDAVAFEAAAILGAQATNTGSGTTDVDVTLGSKVSGTFKDFLWFDASEAAAAGRLNLGTVSNPLANLIVWADGTGDGEVTLPNDSIGAAEIATNAVTNGSLADAAVGIAELSATGTADGTTFLRGDNTWATAGTTMPAQASAPSNPSAGTFQPWLDTDDNQVNALKSDGTNYVLLRRQTSTPTTGALMGRWDGSEVDEIAGASVDTSGNLTVNGLTIAGGGSVTHTLTSYTDTFTVGTTARCLDFVAHDGDFSGEGSGVSTWGRIPFANQNNPFSFHSATITLTSMATPANFSSGEKISMQLYTCTDVTTSGPNINTGCTLRDRVIFENSASPSTYGTTGSERTAIACQTQPCIGSFVLDGTGLEPQGTTSFSAGSFKYWVVCMDSDDTNHTADTTADPGAIEIVNTITLFN